MFRDTTEDEERHYELLELIPNVTISRPTRYVHETILVHAGMADKWIMELEKQITDDETETWMAAMNEKWAPRMEHAKLCSRWLSERQHQIYWEKRRVIDDRRDVIVEHLRSLGWGDELDRMAHRVVDLGEIPSVEKACQKDITHQALLSLQQELITHMVMLKACRMEREQESLVLQRVTVSREVYNTCISNLPVNAIYPPIAELFRLPFVLNIVNNSVVTGNITKEDLEPINLSFDDLTHQWRVDKEIQLWYLLVSGYDYEPSPEIVFDLATTFFFCSFCSRFLRHPQVLMHSCTRNFNRLGSETNLLKDVRSDKVLWNSNRQLGVQKVHVEFVSGLLQMVGIDLKTTVVQEMDFLDPIFECVPCNDIREGRATMSWKTTLVHVFHPHVGCRHSRTPKEALANLKLLVEEEANEVRSRMLEQEERIRHRTRDDNMVCPLCKRKGNFLDLWKHIQSTHSEANLTRKDIVLDVDANDTPALYRLWPPRFDQSPR